MPRAVELAATAVGLGVAGHMLGGGSVSPAVLVPAFVPLLILAKFCARKELTSTLIALSLVLGQSWVHLLASLTGHHNAASGSSMFLGHAFATTVALAILRRREALTWSKARRRAIAVYVRSVLQFNSGFKLPTPRLVLPRIAYVDLEPVSRFIVNSATRRGPPCWETA
jgi:hypothetical protein